jgi:AcrR family transcriptional regulator
LTEKLGFNFMVVKSSLSAQGDSRPLSGHPGESRRRGRPSRRDEILQAAVELFAKGGSRDTSIAAIAERIGVTPAAVMHHFKSKNDLMREVVAEIDSERPDFDEPEPRSAIDSFAWLGAWGHVLETDERQANLRRLAAVMVAEALDADHPSHDYFVSRHRNFRESVAKVIQAGIEEGDFRPDVDVEVVATMVVGLAQGIQLQWFLDPKNVPVGEVFEKAWELLTAVLTGEPTPKKITIVRKSRRTSK